MTSTGVSFCRVWQGHLTASDERKLQKYDRENKIVEEIK
jgi:hypothetical protein